MFIKYVTGRKKRQSDSSGERNTCGLLVVIDTKFLTGITNGDTDRATNYVVSLNSEERYKLEGAWGLGQSTLQTPQWG